MGREEGGILKLSCVSSSLDLVVSLIPRVGIWGRNQINGESGFSYSCVSLSRQ